MSGTIRVGVGGWTYEPWRDNFYPKGLSSKGELAYASRHVTAIEINGTFYRTQTATSFAKWRDETPDGFVFSVKGHRSVVSQKSLAASKEGVPWFLGTGVLELKEKLGPILWQLPPHKRFEAEDIGPFLARLPREMAGRPLRHAIEPRHDSFKDPAFVELARAASVAIVYADSAKYPAIADVTAGFVYARLQRAEAAEETGYPPAELDRWAERSRDWAAGRAAEGLPVFGTAAKRAARDVFVFMINGAKERAPAAAQSLIARLQP